MTVHPATASRTTRLAPLIAAALVLFVTAMPAAAACCLAKPGAEVASMHASMPCCAPNCTMSNPDTGRDQDVTLAPAPAPQAASTAAALITAAPATHVTSTIAAVGHASDAYAAPPPFLINRQFRI